MLVHFLRSSARIFIDASCPVSMSLCPGRKSGKPNEDTWLDCYQKRRRRRVWLSAMYGSLVGCQQKAEDRDGVTPGSREKPPIQEKENASMWHRSVLWKSKDKVYTVHLP